MPLGDYQAVAVYDLLALTPDNRLVILDWKTSRKIPRRAWINERMQTVLYPFAALESAGNFLPEVTLAAQSIQMTYVYVRHASDNVLTFANDDDQHAASRVRLERLVEEIAALESGEFPLTMRRSAASSAYTARCVNAARTPAAWRKWKEWKPNPSWIWTRCWAGWTSMRRMRSPFKDLP